ncbi:uncharacterized protein LOC112145505 isoform X2 [Oryzias melastigma]|uniref:uncharacterized protein LOC112145505 isoform X2 n=1 Tax=Oryzias melastigma TaxID=30732 RepID=UPI000CF7DB1F|nr:uncharacterized protein LOC112145505 isoform X2 [Oryzias melastigma]
MWSHADRHASSNVDQLTVKYMEMCKVGSSTDSDSEISSRWPETSVVACPRSATEPETSQQIHTKPSRSCVCYSLLLDPYDGSSEDSESNIEVSSRKTRQRRNGGAGFPFSSQRRRSALNQREMLRNEMRDGSDVQMKYHTDSDLWDCELDTSPCHIDSIDCKMITEESESHSLQHIYSMDTECQLGDSGLYGSRSSTPITPAVSSSAESSCKFKSLWKRKVNFSAVEVVDSRPSKKQCVTTEEEKE